MPKEGFQELRKKSYSADLMVRIMQELNERPRNAGDLESMLWNESPSPMTTRSVISGICSTLARRYVAEEFEKDQYRLTDLEREIVNLLPNQESQFAQRIRNLIGGRPLI